MDARKVIARPITQIHEMELSSICNLACVYCPHPSLKREKAHMGWDTFERALLHLQHFVDAGTQGELSLTGIGEAILHPRFPEALRRCREVMGSGRLMTMGTNGIEMTPELAALCAEQGVWVRVSLHRPEVAGPAMAMLRAAGCKTDSNQAFVDNSKNWAGQVKWHASTRRYPCGWLGEGWCSVRQSGQVTTCCEDAHALHPVASVWDEPGSWVTHATALCASCHLIVPASLMEVARVSA